MTVTELSEIPSTEHWAIIEGDSIYHEGDERSRTNPGHGYPAYTEKIITYKAYPSLESVTQEITRRANSKYSSDKAYRVMHVKPLTVRTEVKVLL